MTEMKQEMNTLQIARHLEEFLQGRLVRIQTVHRSGAMAGLPGEQTFGVCTAVHPTEYGSVDVEIVGGNRYGFCPEHKSVNQVLGTVFGGHTLYRTVTIANSNMEPWHFAITAGPSREELFDALRLTSLHLSVLFTVADCYKFTAVVRGIEAEDGSGESWNLMLADGVGHLGGTRLKAYYSTKRRAGTVSVLR